MASEITVLERPKGEAGSTSPKGFNLQEAMGLEDKSLLYNDMLVSYVTRHV